MARNMSYINIMIKYGSIHTTRKIDSSLNSVLSCRQKVTNPLSSLCRVVNKKVCHQQSEFVGTLVTDVGVDQTNPDYLFDKKNTSYIIREDKGDTHILTFHVVRLGKLLLNSLVIFHRAFLVLISSPQTKISQNL